MWRTSPAPKQRGWRYWRNLILVAMAGLATGLSLALYVVPPIDYAHRMSHPQRLPVCCVTPADRSLAYEDVSFTTGDGLTLYGWYIPSHASRGAAVMVAHGLGGNRIGIGQLDQAAALARRGYGVLLFDLRAHGDSDGDAISFGAEDALAALAYLQNRADVDPDRIGAMGLSLGAIVVTQAAARSPGVKAVIADGLGHAAFRDFPPPATLEDWVWAPFRWVAFKSLEARGVSTSAVVDAIDDIAPRPILFISGAGQGLERETVRRYYAAAGEPKTLWEIPEAGHGGTWAARPDEFEEKIVAFFDQAPRLRK